MGYKREQVEAAVKAKGYVYFEDTNNKGFDVNIIGIRNSATGQKVTNAFDDLLTLNQMAKTSKGSSSNMKVALNKKKTGKAKKKVARFLFA